MVNFAAIQLVGPRRPLESIPNCVAILILILILDPSDPLSNYRGGVKDEPRSWGADGGPESDCSLPLASIMGGARLMSGTLTGRVANFGRISTSAVLNAGFRAGYCNCS